MTSRNCRDAMAAALLSDDPNRSAEILLGLRDGRVHLQTQVAKWLKKDRPEARRWLASTELLNDHEKAQLRAAATPESANKQ